MPFQKWTNIVFTHFFTEKFSSTLLDFFSQRKSLEWVSCQLFRPEISRSSVSVRGRRGIVVHVPSVLYHERLGWYGHFRPFPLLPSAAEEVAAVLLLLLNELLVADADHHHHHDDRGDPQHQDDSRQVVQLALCRDGQVEVLGVRGRTKLAYVFEAFIFKLYCTFGSFHSNCYIHYFFLIKCLFLSAIWLVYPATGKYRCYTIYTLFS